MPGAFVVKYFTGSRSAGFSQTDSGLQMVCWLIRLMSVGEWSKHLYLYHSVSIASGNLDLSFGTTC